MKIMSKSKFAYILLAPAVLFIVGFMLYPVGVGIYLSFTNKQLMKSATFVGLRNYQQLLFKDEIFRTVLVHTVIWSSLMIAGVTVIGLALALLLNQNFRGRSILRTLFVIPWPIPYIVAGIIWKWLYADQFGYFDRILMGLGITNASFGFLSDPNKVLFSLIATIVWRNYPFNMLVCLAALQSISPDLYEAAIIDGAGTWAKFRYITLPGIKVVIILIILLQFVWSFNHFTLVYVMSKGGPGHASHILGSYAYELAFGKRNVGYASSVATMMFVVLIFVTFLYLRVMMKEEE